ncbi:MAG: hypothetical protein B7X12_07420, partial [Halothiobacillus sp. 20-53-49]
GIYITASQDGGATYASPVRYSAAMGSLFSDEESAYEAQIVTRPDGTRFYGMWNQANATTPGVTAAEYASGSIATVADALPAPVLPAPTVASTTSTGGGGSFAPWFMLALMPLFAVRRRLMKK